MLLLGLLGFGATMLVFSFVESLTAGYAERLLSGMFAAAVTPVAGSLTTTEQGRARRLALVSMASIAGFMFGPMLGVIIARYAEEVLTLATPAQSIGIFALSVHPLAHRARARRARGRLFLVPRAADFTSMLVVIGAVAAGAGVLTAILTYWISAKAGSAQSWLPEPGALERAHYVRMLQGYPAG